LWIITASSGLNKRFLIACIVLAGLFGVAGSVLADWDS
jgi:hypothetical protein